MHNSPSRFIGLFRLTLADEIVLPETKAMLVIDEAIVTRTGLIYRTGSVMSLTGNTVTRHMILQRSSNILRTSVYQDCAYYLR
jgi:hypothetical protein